MRLKRVKSINSIDTGVEKELSEGRLWVDHKKAYKDYLGNDKEYVYTDYRPQDDSKYKRLIRKPVNTLTLDEVVYIYAV